MHAKGFGIKAIATAAATCALMGVGGLAVGAGTATAAPPVSSGFSTDRPHWPDYRDRNRWDRWRDDRTSCVQVTGPFGHVTWTSCR